MEPLSAFYVRKQRGLLIVYLHNSTIVKGSCSQPVFTRIGKCVPVWRYCVGGTACAVAAA